MVVIKRRIAILRRISMRLFDIDLARKDFKIKKKKKTY
jgi:hypothetical protein